MNINFKGVITLAKILGLIWYSKGSHSHRAISYESKFIMGSQTRLVDFAPETQVLPYMRGSHIDLTNKNTHWVYQACIQLLTRLKSIL